MGKMKSALYDIEQMLMQGESAEFIASSLDVPIKWVEQMVEDLHYLNNQMEYSVNSYQEQYD